MIAVFCRYQRDFDTNRFLPKKMFVRIKSNQDIRGRTFTGAVLMHDWYLIKELNEAYEDLHRRQPELFK